MIEKLRLSIHIEYEDGMSGYKLSISATGCFNGDVTE